MAVSQPHPAASVEQVINERLPIGQRLELKRFLQYLPLQLKQGRAYLFFVSDTETFQTIQAYLQDKLSGLLDPRPIAINGENVDLLLHLKGRLHDKDYRGRQRLLQINTLSIPDSATKQRLYSDLNLRREWIRELELKLLFWFKDEDLPDIQRAAPDFWRFRARSLRLALEPDLLVGPTDYTAIKHDIAELEDKVRQIKKGEREEDLPDLAYYTDRLARTYYDFGKFMAAVDAWQTLLSISKKLNGKKWEAAAVGNLGLVYHNLGEYDKARGYHEQALEIHRELGNRLGEASQLGNLGIVYRVLGEYDLARGYHEQALEIDRELGNRLGEAQNLGNLGLAYHNLGEYDKARGYLEQALEIHRELGNRLGEAQDLGNLGLVYSNLGEYDLARGCHEQALEIDRELGNRLGEANQLGNLGLAYHNLGEYDKARGYHEQALEIAKELGSRSLEATIVDNLKSLESRSGTGNITGTVHEDHVE
ncbi:MAG: hypothetical protein C4B58_01785 [Deltaproteobacteria bacterium]|nr:MAG: hypothetical protein C4B58_01785 [Deltaproteobacteria bacterium]